MEYSSSVLEKAVNELAKLPGVGEKTALRYALWLLKQSDEQVDSMIRSISDLKTKIHQCQKCNNLSDMPFALSPEAVGKNAAETEVLLLPMLKEAKEKWAELSDILFVLRTNIRSVNDILKLQYNEEYEKWKKEYEL